MSKAKKKTIILISVLVVVSVVIFLLAWSLGAFSQKPLDDYDKYIKVINENDKSDFMLYGDDLQFREHFKYRKLQSLENEEIFKNEEAQFRFLVVIDEQNKLSISQQEIDNIVNYVKEENLVVVSLHSELSKKLISFNIYENKDKVDLMQYFICAISINNSRKIGSMFYLYRIGNMPYDNIINVLKICSRIVLNDQYCMTDFY